MSLKKLNDFATNTLMELIQRRGNACINWKFAAYIAFKLQQSYLKQSARIRQRHSNPLQGVIEFVSCLAYRNFFFTVIWSVSIKEETEELGGAGGETSYPSTQPKKSSKII